MNSSDEVEVEEFFPHPYQKKILQSHAQTLLMCAGEQGGKTITGAIFMLREVEKFKKTAANFIVGAPTYKIMEQSTRPTMMKLLSQRMGVYDGKDDAFRLRNGGSIYFRSSTDPDSVVGIPDAVAGWIDELGKCSRLFYFNVKSRLARLKGRFIGTTTPYALNFVKKEIIDKREDGEIEYVQFSSTANPTYPKEEFERLRRVLPTRIFRMRLEGFHDKAEGLIFEDWGDENWVDPFQIPPTARIFGGLDWGFGHPFALVIRALMPEGMYTISLFKGSGLSVMDQIKLITSKTQLFGVKRWFCGHDRPDMILELNRAGVQACKYFEGQDHLREVNAGNQKHAELIRGKRLKCFRGIDQANDLQDEYDTYCWDNVEEDDYRAREKPRALNDDLMAAERYCTVGIQPYVKEKVEKMPERLIVRQKRDVEWKNILKVKKESWESY